MVCQNVFVLAHFFFMLCVYISYEIKILVYNCCIILCGSFAFGQQNYHLKKSLWKNEMYNSYNHNSILKYQPIYATINPRAVDIPLR